MDSIYHHRVPLFNERWSESLKLAFLSFRHHCDRSWCFALCTVKPTYWISWHRHQIYLVWEELTKMNLCLPRLLLDFIQRVDCLIFGLLDPATCCNIICSCQNKHFLWHEFHLARRYLFTDVLIVPTWCCINVPALWACNPPINYGPQLRVAEDGTL